MGSAVTRYAAGSRPAKFWAAMGPMFASAAVRRALQTLHDDPETDDWFFVANKDGAVASFACLRTSKGDEAELCHCWTDPDQREKGLSAAVKAELIKVAKEKGLKKLAALASLAHKPGLEKAGFKPLAQQPRGGKWNYTKMELAL